MHQADCIRVMPTDQMKTTLQMIVLETLLDVCYHPLDGERYVSDPLAGGILEEVELTAPGGQQGQLGP